MDWEEVWDRVSFRELRSLFTLGALRDLQTSELPPLPLEESSSELSRIAFGEWRSSESLFKALWNVTRRLIIRSTPLALLGVCCQLALPLVLRELLIWIARPSTSSDLIGAFYVALLFLLRLLSASILRQQTYVMCARAGVRAERAAMVLVSRKLLRLLSGTRGTREVVSALATDATRFGPDLLSVLHLV